MASSINFALKSADEQAAIIVQFQNFLNSLEFTVQFFIESRDSTSGPTSRSSKSAMPKSSTT